MCIKKIETTRAEREKIRAGIDGLEFHAIDIKSNLSLLHMPWKRCMQGIALTLTSMH
jgi:hypothetical protein